MDILKADIQHAQLRHIQEIQAIIDLHVCESIPKKKGFFGKKVHIEIEKKDSPYQAPMSRGWSYQTPLPSLPSVPHPPPEYANPGLERQKLLVLISQVRGQAYKEVKKSDQLTEVLLYLTKLEQRINES